MEQKKQPSRPSPVRPAVDRAGLILLASGFAAGALVVGLPLMVMLLRPAEVTVRVPELEQLSVQLGGGAILTHSGPRTFLNDPTPVQLAPVQLDGGLVIDGSLTGGLGSAIDVELTPSSQWADRDGVPVIGVLQANEWKPFNDLITGMRRARFMQEARELGEREAAKEAGLSLSEWRIQQFERELEEMRGGEEER